MPVHIDEPAPGADFDPADFSIRGWLWLEGRHDDLVRVEALCGELVLGTADVAAFYERPDVSAKYDLPAGLRTAFEFRARHPHVAPGQRFELQLRATLRDGTRTAPLFASRVGPLPADRDPLGMLRARLEPRARGLEIGAHTRPTPGLDPFFTDSVAAYVGSEGRVDFLADAVALPLPDDTLDYLCSSHVLEHLPDPLAALHEWHRVLRPGGWLYLVVPDKRFTFDQPRPVTTCAHLVDDFVEARTAATSFAHVDEFVFQTNWSLLRPGTPAADQPAERAAAREEYLRDLRAGRGIDIHFHTFVPESLHAVLAAGGFVGAAGARCELLAQAERYPPGRDDGIGLLLRKTGASAARAASRETFSLPHAHATVPPLPLVCPVSLSPLREEISRDGERSLVAAGSGLRYGFAAGRPALLPPAGQNPTRPWSDRAWRTARVTGASTHATAPLGEVRAHVDEPAPSTVVDPLCFPMRGWLWLGAAQSRVAAVEAWSGDTLIGETTALYARPDVTAALGLEAAARTGFDLFAHHAAATGGAPLEIEVRARLTDGSRTPALVRSCAATIARDYRRNHFGILLDRDTVAIQGRTNVFAQGPSCSSGSDEVAALIRRYLGPAPRRVLDVGCGLGSYGRGLIADGYDWIGAEIDADDCAELARLGLPHRRVDGRALPFPDASFDAALCLEVLEHIADPHAFLAEVHRVAPRQLIVSVPNCELLGYLWDHLAAPWHMLEADHKNFFTRWSLGALLRQFYGEVEVRFHTPYPLRTVEGTPLHYHLLAVATTRL